MVTLSYSITLVVICSILYFIIAIFGIKYWYNATKADPTDPTIRL